MVEKFVLVRYSCQYFVHGILKFHKSWNSLRFVDHQNYFENQEDLIVLELIIGIVIRGVLVLVLEFMIKFVDDDYFVVVYDKNEKKLE